MKTQPFHFWGEILQSPGYQCGWLNITSSIQGQLETGNKCIIATVMAAPHKLIKQDSQNEKEVNCVCKW